MGTLSVGDSLRSVLVASGSSIGDIYVSISEPVSGLQFTIVTDGTISGVGSQSLDYVQTGTNTYLVLVWVTTAVTFDGEFMKVSGGAITSISNVLASDIDGNEVAGVTISY